MYRNLVNVAKDVVNLANKKELIERERRTYKVVLGDDLEVPDEIKVFSNQIIELLMRFSAFLPISPWYEEYFRFRRIRAVRPRTFIRRWTFL